MYINLFVFGVRSYLLCFPSFGQYQLVILGDGAEKKIHKKKKVVVLFSGTSPTLAIEGR